MDGKLIGDSAIFQFDPAFGAATSKIVVMISITTIPAQSCVNVYRDLDSTLFHLANHCFGTFFFWMGHVRCHFGWFFCMLQ